MWPNKTAPLPHPAEICVPSFVQDNPKIDPELGKLNLVVS